MHLLIMQRTWPHFILKEHHPTQEWLKTWCTDWIVQQEWCLLSYTFLWNRAPQPTNTPGETLLCGSWLAAKVPSYKLQGPFLVQELFFMLSLSCQVASIQKKWQCTDRLKLIRTETLGKDEWASWGCCWLCEHYRWFMDSQPSTLSVVVLW